MRLFKQLFILASCWHLFNCWATISLVASIFLLGLQHLLYVKMLSLWDRYLTYSACTTQLAPRDIYTRLALKSKKAVKELEKSLGSNLDKYIFHYFVGCVCVDKPLGIMWFSLPDTECLQKTSGPKCLGWWQGLARSLSAFVQGNLAAAGAEQVQARAARQSALEKEVIPVPGHKCAGGDQQLRDNTAVGWWEACATSRGTTLG